MVRQVVAAPPISRPALAEAASAVAFHLASVYCSTHHLKILSSAFFLLSYVRGFLDAFDKRLSPAQKPWSNQARHQARRMSLRSSAPLPNYAR